MEELRRGQLLYSYWSNKWTRSRRVHAADTAVTKICLSHADTAQRKRKRRKIALSSSRRRYNFEDVVSWSIAQSVRTRFQCCVNQAALLCWTIVVGSVPARQSQVEDEYHTRLWHRRMHHDPVEEVEKCKRMGLHSGVIGKEFDGEVEEVSNPRDIW